MVCEFPSDLSKAAERGTQSHVAKEAPATEEDLVLGDILSPPKPISLNLKPQPIELQPNEPLSHQALVSKPAVIAGVRSWTIETIGHRFGVGAIAVSPDGQRFATAGMDGTLRIWEATTGKLLRAFVGHAMPVRSLAWSPDGKILASGGQWQDRVCLWDMSTGAVLRIFFCEGSNSRPLHWSPDGRQLATGLSKDIEVWNGDLDPLHESPRILRGHSADVASLAWSPDGRFLASCADDKAIKLWRSDTLEVHRTLQGPEQPPANANCLAWSPDGQMLLCAYGNGGPLAIWDVNAGRIIHTVAGGGFDCVAWSSDGQSVAGGSIYRKAPSVWSIASHEPIWAATAPPNTGSLRFFREGKRLAVGGYDTLDVLELDSGRCELSLPAHGAHGRWSVNPMAVSWDGKQVATGFFERDSCVVRIWNSESGKIHREFAAPGFVDQFCWAPDGRFLAGGQLDGLASVWDARTGDQVGTIPRSIYSGIAWSGDGKSVAVNHETNGQVWDLPPKQQRCSLPGGLGGVAFSPDGLAVVIGADKAVLLCDARTGELKATLVITAQGKIRGVAWSPAGDTIAAVAGTNRLYLWDAKSYQPEGDSKLSDVCWLDRPTLAWVNDATMVCGNTDYTAIWDSKQARLMRPVLSHRGNNPWPVSVAKDVIAFPGPSLVRLHRIADGALLRTVVSLRDHQYAVISPEGHFAGSPDVEREFVYVVQTDTGQETLTPEEFTRKYGWTNDPLKASSVK
ncbi:MAG: WD40 repeat domain-containing protein [Planctomycetota bacterium]|nr:WD40 repeat domain-containing protein [Planctomycetota bacterium]